MSSINRTCIQFEGIPARCSLPNIRKRSVLEYMPFSIFNFTIFQFGWMFVCVWLRAIAVLYCAVLHSTVFIHSFVQTSSNLKTLNQSSYLGFKSAIAIPKCVSQHRICTHCAQCSSNTSHTTIPSTRCQCHLHTKLY